MAETRCAECGKPLPPERDPSVTVYCSPRCYVLAQELSDD